MGNLMFFVKLEKDWEVCKYISEKVEGKVSWFGDVFCSRSWSFYTATWQNDKMFIRTFLDNMQFLSCVHHPISQQFSCTTIPPYHIVKWVKQLLEAENIEIMLWSPWSKPNRKPLQNSWEQSYYQDTHFGHQTGVTGRVEQNASRVVCKFTDILWPQICSSHWTKAKPLHFLLTVDCCNLQVF